MIYATQVNNVYTIKQAFVLYRGQYQYIRSADTHL